MELAGITEKKLQPAMRREVYEKGPKLSITEGGQEGKSKGDCVMQLSGREVAGRQQKTRSRSYNSGNTGSGLENENEAVGSKRERSSRTEEWCEEAVEDGPGSCESVERTKQLAFRTQKR